MTKERVRHALRNELPGKMAHLQFYPARVGREADPGLDVNLRKAAVAVILCEVDSKLSILLIQRSLYDGKHSGQIAFPGGKQELSDVDMLHTALRETAEEVGIASDELEFLGKLTPVYVSVSSFLVEPYVFWWNSVRADLEISPREVQQVLYIALEDLIEENIVQLDIDLGSAGILKSVPHFSTGSINIWGATGLILNELRMVLI